MDNTYWQKEFFEMKAHKPKLVRVLIEGTRGFIDDWQFGSWHEEFRSLKKEYRNRRYFYL